MPALSAYLLSLVIFIGGGYAGLVWLTERPASVPTVVATAKAHARARPHRQARMLPDVSGSDNVDGEQSSPGSQAKVAKTDVVGTSASREADASSPSDESRDKAPDQQTAGGQESTTNVQADRGNQTNADNQTSIGGAVNQTPGASKATGDAQTRATLAHDSIGAQTANPPTPTPTSVQAHARPRKVASIRNDARAEKTMERHPPQSTTRSHLVMMTLQTLEFADGHREERLVPYHRYRLDDD